MRNDFLELITATPDSTSATTGTLTAGSWCVHCAFGRGGLTADKREGDGATPTGNWPLRKLFYRADRLTPPGTGLELQKIESSDGWCDAPGHSLYNQIVQLPFGDSHETLQREDHLYDLMIPMGYNDGPIVPGRGSAIFFHLAREDYQPTEGCVAISRADMELLLPMLSARTILRVTF
ncbi:MAG: L,D-transpeptidase family protein [Pseudomonadota bacterium]